MNSIRKTMLLAQLSRGLATSASRKALPQSLKVKMEKMQVPDGRPVHLKGGPVDKIMMQVTFLLCVAGLGGCFKLFWDLSVPKK